MSQTMNWQEFIVAILGSFLTTLWTLYQIMSRMLASKYVTRDELESASREIKTSQILQASNLSKASGQIDVISNILEERPDFGHLSAIKDKVFDIEKTVAVNSARIGHIESDLHEALLKINNINEILLKAGQGRYP